MEKYFYQGSKAAFLLFLGFILAGCVTTGTGRIGQAALKALETREVDASFEMVYAAAVEGLFDLGYTIAHSDKGSGVIVGEKRVEKSGAGWMRFNDSANKVVRPESDYYNTLQLTLLIRSIDESVTKIRIKTAVNKEPKLDKEAIDEVWLYIERQVLMEGEPASVVFEENPDSDSID